MAPSPSATELALHGAFRIYEVRNAIRLCPALWYNQVNMSDPWISPLGSGIDSFEATLEADPAYREARRRRAPYEYVARALIVYRMKANLSQKELAERAGTSPATIRRLERGDNAARHRTLKRLVEIVGPLSREALT
jgi:DNA-binding XRE family transcriptional regulator